MKKRTRLGIIYITILFLTFTNGVRGNSIEPSDVFVYNVTEASSTINYFYGAWPPGTYYGNWLVNAGDKIIFNVTTVSEESINGTLTLGDVVFSNIRNIDVASALAFSIYPWLGGFLANSSDWNAISQLVKDTNTTITVEEITREINGNNITRVARIFDVNNYYGQNSRLVYDNSTGILLEGRTSFGNYYLSVVLESTSVNFSTQAQKTPWGIMTIPLAAMFVITIKNRKRTI